MCGFCEIMYAARFLPQHTLGVAGLSVFHFHSACGTKEYICIYCLRMLIVVLFCAETWREKQKSCTHSRWRIHFINNEIISILNLCRCYFIRWARLLRIFKYHTPSSIMSARIWWIRHHKINFWKMPRFVISNSVLLFSSPYIRWNVITFFQLKKGSTRIQSRDGKS